MCFSRSFNDAKKISFKDEKEISFFSLKSSEKEKEISLSSCDSAFSPPWPTNQCGLP